MAEIRREHRERAAAAYFEMSIEDGHPARGWVLSGRHGHGSPSQWRALDRIAKLLAREYFVGRNAERADVIAECERTERLSSSDAAHSITAMRVRIQRGEHARRAG